MWWEFFTSGLTNASCAARQNKTFAIGNRGMWALCCEVVSKYSLEVISKYGLNMIYKYEKIIVWKLSLMQNADIMFYGIVLHSWAPYMSLRKSLCDQLVLKGNFSFKVFILTFNQHAYIYYHLASDTGTY